MRQVILKGLWLVFATFCSLPSCLAQESSITVDNQTPGWLSSKLTYDQQQSLTELHVTGYLNGDDATFINNLINNHSLIRLDLYGANIVDGGTSMTTKKNILGGNFFKLSKHMERIILPQNLDSVNFSSSNILRLDTLSIGCRRISTNFLSNLSSSYFDSTIIDIMEGVEEIGYHAFYYDSSTPFNNSPIRKLPSTLKNIEKWAFGRYFLADTLDISTFTQLEHIGPNKVVNYSYWGDDTSMLAWYKGGIKKEINGTFKFPSNLIAWNSSYRSATYSDGTPKRYDCYDKITADTIVVPSTCELLYADLKADIAYFYATTPPERINSNCYKINKLYVPKGCLETYQKKYSVTNDGIQKILEMLDVESIFLNETKIELLVGEEEILTATILPVDAFNKKVTWKSEDPDIVSVDNNGNIQALKAGTTRVVVTTEDGGFTTSCEVSVIQPVTGISLNFEEYTLEKLGQVIELLPCIIPEDASNKKVTWESSNESVCIVANGKIVAVGNGVSVVTAKTEDGGFTAICIIIVDTTSDIKSINDDYTSSEIYDINGRITTKQHKGIKIINKKGKIIKLLY